MGESEEFLDHLVDEEPEKNVLQRGREEEASRPTYDRFVSLYLQLATRTPLLTRESEQKLFKRKGELQYQLLERLCQEEVGILGRAFGRYAMIGSVLDDFPLPRGYTPVPYGETDYTLFTEKSEGASQTFRSKEYERVKEAQKSLRSAKPKERPVILAELVADLYEFIPNVCLDGASKEYLNLITFKHPSPEESLKVHPSISEYLTLKGRRDRVYQEIINSNLRLVISIAKHYLERGLEFLDLISEGNIGMMKAADKFDWRRGHKFSTYATWWTRQAITHSLAEYSKNIRVPLHVQETNFKIVKEGQRFANYHGRRPTFEEYDEMLNLRTGTAERILTRNPRTISLSTPVGEEGDTIMKFMEDHQDPTPLDILLGGENEKIVRRLLQKMDGQPGDSPHKSRDRIVIEARYGIDCAQRLTLGETGKLFQVTRERARQIEARGIKILRRIAKES